MVKRKVGNRVYITTTPKEVVYVPTEEDKMYGYEGTPERIIYNNNIAIKTIGYEIGAAINLEVPRMIEIADKFNIKLATIETLIQDASKSQVGILLKVCNHLNIDIKSIL